MDKKTELARLALKVPVNERINRRHGEQVVAEFIATVQAHCQEESSEEIESLRQQLHDAEESNKAVERALKDVDYRGSYADGVLYLKQQLSAVLAAIEAKDASLSRHIKVDDFLINCPFDVEQKAHEDAIEEHTASFENMKEALAIKPDAFPLKAHDEALIERCLQCYSPDDSAADWADKIRALKGKL